MEKFENNINRYLLLAVIVLLGAFLFHSLSNFFSAFLGSVVFYELTKSFMHKATHQWHWKKPLTAILIIFVTAIVVLIPFSIIGTMLYGKVAEIIREPQTILNMVNELDQFVEKKLHFKLISNDTMRAIPQYGAKLAGSILSTGLTTFSDILMMYFFLYFMLVSSERMEEIIALVIPFNQENVQRLGKELHVQTVSNAIGIPLIAVAQGLCGFLAYWLGGVQQPGFWGVATGICSVIPVVGSGIIWVPIAIYLFSQHMIWQAIAVTLICAIVLGSLDNVIRFVLAKKMADVHPIITILGVIMGLNVFGISGLIFGPFIISIFFILIRIYFLDYKHIDLSKENKPNSFDDLDIAKPPLTNKRASFGEITGLQFINKKKRE